VSFFLGLPSFSRSFRRSCPRLSSRCPPRRLESASPPLFPCSRLVRSLLSLLCFAMLHNLAQPCYVLHMTTPLLKGAKCADDDPERWFLLPDKINSPQLADEVADVIRTCLACPARSRCLDLALEFEGDRGPDSRFGIWGGTTPAERAAGRQKAVTA